MSTDSLIISIKDIELKKMKYYLSDDASEVITNLDITVDIVEERIKNKESTIFVDFNGVFDFKLEGIVVEGEYLFSAVFSDIQNKDSFANLLEENKYEMCFPMISRINMIISKISEESRPFPLLISPDIWLKDQVDSDEDDE